MILSSILGLFGNWFDACTAYVSSVDRVNALQFTDPIRTTTSTFTVLKGNPKNFDPQNLQSAVIGENWEMFNRVPAEDWERAGNIVWVCNWRNLDQRRSASDLVRVSERSYESWQEILREKAWDLLRVSKRLQSCSWEWKRERDLEKVGERSWVSERVSMWEWARDLAWVN